MQTNNKRKTFTKIVSTLGVLLILVGVSYSFFNYTRTGVDNTIRVGQIEFNARQTNTITLLNAFPIDKNEVTTSNNVDEGTILISGNTTYDEGIEYVLTIANLTNRVGNKEIPIDIKVLAGGIGDEEEDYYSERGGETSIYKVLKSGTIANNDKVLVGYINKGATGIDGTITIKAYIDKEKIAISDTYPEKTVRTVKTTGYDNTACEVVLTGVANASTICATAASLQEAIDTENTLTSAQINSLVTAGIVEEYTDGTPESFGEGRTVLTTTEWNSLQQNGVSFSVKVEANEGTWVTPPAAETIGALQTLETTPYGKVYSGISPDNYVWFNNEQWRIIGVYTDEVNGDMLKIIKATPYTTDQQYNSSDSSNAWSGSSMQTYLYNNYNSIISDATSREMIFESGKWNVGAVAYNENASEDYNSAIGTPWTGKIGLIASHEYLYGAENDGTCWSQPGRSFDGYGGLTDCKAKDWLFSTVTNSGGSNAWTLNPYSGLSSLAMRVNGTGFVSNFNVTTRSAASPVVYLKSNITITGGTGEIGETNSYKLGF